MRNQNTIEPLLYDFNLSRLKRIFLVITILWKPESSYNKSSKKHKYWIPRISLKKYSSPTACHYIIEYLRKCIKRLDVMEDKPSNDQVKRLVQVVQFHCI